jgi:signal transduction histidine kinase
MTRRLLGPVGGPVLFLLIAALVFAGLGWVTVAALRVEKDQRQTAAEAQQANALRLALWRLDGRVLPVLGVEDNRPFHHYAGIADPTIYGSASTPLLEPDLPHWMRLHFQIDTERGWSSPQVIPQDEADELRELWPALTLRNVTPERAALLGELKRRYPPRHAVGVFAARERAIPEGAPHLAVPFLSPASPLHEQLQAYPPASQPQRPPSPSDPGAGLPPASVPPNAGADVTSSTVSPEYRTPYERFQQGAQAGGPQAAPPPRPSTPTDNGVAMGRLNNRPGEQSSEYQKRVEIGQRGADDARRAATYPFSQNQILGANPQSGGGPGVPGPGGPGGPTQGFGYGAYGPQAQPGGGFGGSGGGLGGRPGLQGGGGFGGGTGRGGRPDNPAMPASPPAPGLGPPAGPTTAPVVPVAPPVATTPPGPGASLGLAVPPAPAGPLTGSTQPSPKGKENLAKDNNLRLPGVAGGAMPAKEDRSGASDAEKAGVKADPDTRPAAPGKPLDDKLVERGASGGLFRDVGEALRVRRAALGRPAGDGVVKEAPGRDPTTTGLAAGMNPVPAVIPPADGAPTFTPPPVVAAADPPIAPFQPITVHLGSMRPQWLPAEDGTEVLVLVRTARIDNRTVYQGVVLDWPRLEAVLREEVKDLFPEARLVPVKDPVGVSPERAMTALPVQLDPGPAPVAAATGWTPLRFGLVLAWVAALIAFAAVGLCGWSLVDLAERRIRFVSAVTHELRTPLTSLRLYLDLLLSGMVHDEEKRREYLATLNTESDRLHRLIDNVLDFARLEKRRKAKESQPVRIAELMEQLRQTWAERCAADDKELVVISTLPQDEKVCTDADLVHQIVGNLIDNARKYTRDAGDRRIWVWAKPGGRNRVAFEVEDRGPGVPSRERGLIFRPFRRGESADTKAGGAGLGLALAKQWAELLGGRLSYRPADGGVGACFRLELRVK